MADEKPEAKIAPAEKPPEENNLIVELEKTVVANGETVKELKFREPTGADIEAVGSNPINIDFSTDPPKVNFDTKAMSAMMVRLASVPPSTIKSLKLSDWMTIAYRIYHHFFIPGGM